MKRPFSKLFIRYFLFLFTALLLFSSFRYQLSVQEIENHIDDDVEDYFQVLENRMAATYNDRLRDLVYIRDMTETLLENDRSDEPITDVYYEFSKATGLYDQIRYLDLDGNEIIRVNYEEGIPRVLPESELQNKAKRYYFQAMEIMKHNDIYISPVDLNMENAEIEVPLKPMIRMGMTMQDQAGNPIGYVVMNYLAANWLQTESEFFSSFRDHVITFQEMRIVNNEGYYLQHENAQKEWGFIFPERKEANFSLEYPKIWAERNNKDVLKKVLDQDVVYLMELKRLEPKDPYMSQAFSLGYLVYDFPRDRYNMYFRSAREEALVLLFVSLFVALLGAYFLENSVQSRKELIDSLHHRANRDELTGLLNKSGFLSMVPEEMERWDDGILAIGYFDIDDFKSVNDRYGHAAGDEVLKEVGVRLEEVLRERDLPARIHGDEFNILLKLRKEIDSLVVARRLINRMKDPIETTAGEILLTVSLGIAFFHEEESFDKVAERADRLMYQVKQSGKSDYRIEGLAPESES